MSVVEPAELIRTVFRDVIDGGRHELLPELFTDDFVDHSVFGDNVGHEAFVAYLGMFRAALPDFRHEVIDVLPVGDDRYSWLVRVHATFGGEMMGVQGDGRAIEALCANACRLQDGKVAEHWGPGPESMAAILGQMGVSPEVLAGATP